MADLIPSLFVIAGTALVVGLIFLLVARNKKQREERIKHYASLNGWTCTPVNERFSSGYRLGKGEWMIEALNETTSQPGSSSGSSTVTSITRWFTASARMPDGMVLIGPRQPEVNLGGMGSFLVQAALSLMIGADAEDAQGIESIELGSLELMKRFMIYTNRPETAKELVSLPVESALLNMPPTLPLVVKYSPNGLEVKVQGKRLYDELTLNALVKLGCALLDAAR